MPAAFCLLKKPLLGLISFCKEIVSAELIGEALIRI
jgi:hypothetical protein